MNNQAFSNIWIIVIIPIIVIILISIGGGILSYQYRWLKIIGLIVFTIIIFFLTYVTYIWPILIRDKEKLSKLKLKCPKCGFKFGTDWLKIESGRYHSLHNASIWFKTPFFLRCPRCKKFSWCSIVEDISESNNKNL